jgi:hypothetical protein
MPDLSDLHLSFSRGAKEASPVDQGRNHADALAEAETLSERRAAFVDYVESDEFDQDCRTAADLLKRSDREGLVKHTGQDAPKRAAARVAAIRAGH